jgi:hypothetical protein
MADEQKPSYEDENLSSDEKESGRTRLPLPNEEGNAIGREGKAPTPREILNPDRPDEFGDGDRRS